MHFNDVKVYIEVIYIIIRWCRSPLSGRMRMRSRCSGIENVFGADRTPRSDLGRGGGQTTAICGQKGHGARSLSNEGENRSQGCPICETLRSNCPHLRPIPRGSRPFSFLLNLRLPLIIASPFPVNESAGKLRNYIERFARFAYSRVVATLTWSIFSRLRGFAFCILFFSFSRWSSRIRSAWQIPRCVKFASRFNDVHFATKDQAVKEEDANSGTWGTPAPWTAPPELQLYQSACLWLAAVYPYVRSHWRSRAQLRRPALVVAPRARTHSPRTCAA